MAIKAQHNNVKVAVSIGGDSVGNAKAQFQPSSVSSWVNNAVSSLTEIIQNYHLDGLDIDYEHFQSQPDVFADCIGQLITTLKQNNVISVASIAPFDDDQVQSHYQALWNKYGNLIDYVNFQFYAYDKSTTVSQSSLRVFSYGVQISPNPMVFNVKTSLRLSWLLEWD
eukprot:Gb_07286 [translate_table: standard]